MRHTVFLLFVLLVNLTIAQNQKEVIFSIDNEPVYKDEFVRIYNKNIDLVKDESQKDVDEYLQLFIDYKLKVLQAEELNLDEKNSFKREFDGYRKQLAKNYLTDTNASEALVKEAYDRLLKEVKAKHILVLVDEAASPDDTLNAYNKIVSFRDEALKVGFDAEMKAVHDGRSIYGEDLGYFSVFRMVYPFESAAYNTPVGEISEPIRTKFGYHIIKVEDIRENRGELEVAHVMVASSGSDTPDAKKHAEQKIKEVYEKLKNDELPFEELAATYSDDKASAVNGGRLSRFGSGNLSSSTFEEAAFGLKEPGDFTQPFKSEFGWHIIKLLKKYPVGSYEEEKGNLEMQIKQDSRSKYITEKYVDELKNQYSFKENKEGWDVVEAMVNDSLMMRRWSFDKEDPKVKQELFSINNDKSVKVVEFLSLLEIRQKRAAIKNVDRFVNAGYTSFVQQQILDYKEEHLAEENPEYAGTIKEYRDGLLLFDLMQFKIWDKAKTDTLGLETFYENHKDNYMWKNRAEAVIAKCNSKKIAETVQNLFKANKDVANIKETVNTTDRINAVITSKTIEVGDVAVPESYTLAEGVSKVIETRPGEFYVIKAGVVKSPELKTLEDAKGKVISDYQQYLEQEWLDGLREGHVIEVNKKVLKKVKKEVK
ncbi:peptidylprolyl isomerase [Neptunitalea lumnitzerae]|nr:peptidylprolyl isomerase [Neptunitalea sp. Y10]